MESETKQKRKKKKLLLTSYSCLTKEEAVSSVEDIKDRLKQIFRYHIGEDSSITPYDLFLAVFRLYPEDVDVFQRNYWWGIIKRIIGQMRSTNELFIINKRTKLFVLKSELQLKKYEHKADKHISAIHRIKANAREWVREEKWKEYLYRK